MSSPVIFKSSWANKFWSKVEKKGIDDCWPWIASIVQGRPVFTNSTNGISKRIVAARYVYWLVNGQIPDGMVICHSCDNPICVNPSHLWAGTQAQNLADMTAKGRRTFGDKVANKGQHHPNAKFTDEQAKGVAVRLINGESPTKLARAFGVDRSTIYRTARRSINV